MPCYVAPIVYNIIEPLQFIVFSKNKKRWLWMTFNKHGSFYLRSSWPMKGLKAIDEEPSIFTPQNELLAVDTLGLGRVMVTSLRYWMSVVGLAQEDRSQNGRIILNLTELAKQIKDYDPFFQDIGTAWLLHRNLAKNEKDATTWYWFFNVFQRNKFTKKEFLHELKSYIQLRGRTVADRSLDRDFNCLRLTYKQGEFKDIADYIEEGIISYFSKLNLVKEIEWDTYMKMKPANNKLPAEILLYSILEDVPVEQEQVSIKELFEEKGYIGKIYNLSYVLLMKKLEELEKKGYIKLYNRFGHNHIELIEKDKEKVLINYYRKEA